MLKRGKSRGMSKLEEGEFNVRGRTLLRGVSAKFRVLNKEKPLEGGQQQKPESGGKGVAFHKEGKDEE